MILILIGCESIDRGQEIVDQSIKVHFNKGLDPVHISFDFRDKAYSLKRQGNSYTYTRSFEDSLELIKDLLVNGTSFTRLINGDTIPLTDEWKTKYTSSVNSVLYFLQLPFVLNDPAVLKKYLGEIIIEKEPYFEVQVTFEKDGGGEDYDDQFLFWFHQSDWTMDYFAYSYTEEEGGIRFRKAINRKQINGILFQDYINYEVAVGTPLTSIPALFEANQLKELSQIINKNIVVDYPESP